MHRSIAQRWFGPLGAVAAPVRMVHGAITRVVYGSVRLGGQALGAGIDEVATVDGRTGDAVQAFVNGLWGDDLGRYGECLEIAMAVHDREGVPVPAGSDLAAAFPGATSRIVVLVHGLVENERCWFGSGTGPGLAQALEEHVDLTPVFVRYNSGRRVSHNGSLLAALLEDLYAAWPVAVESVALVGHSMGGLVVRSACESGIEAGHRWVIDVSDVVTVAAPHRGSPLEKLANLAAWGLDIAPETRPLADFVKGRSAGIKDLRFGAIRDGEWKDIDPDALFDNTAGDRTLPAGIRHHFVAGVVTENPSHPVGAIAGDLVVRAGSATGGRFVAPTTSVVLGRRHHFDLLHDPEVIAAALSRLVPGHHR
jgi:pimeloyl-ACP methyl ester carboxylesterase